jgi:hypothetical protein
MEALARATGDVDELVAIKSRDLSVAYHFLEIAQVCLDVGRDDEALDWAERGVRAFPIATDARLREFLADLYHRRSRHDDAMVTVRDAGKSREGLRRSGPRWRVAHSTIGIHVDSMPATRRFRAAGRTGTCVSALRCRT